MSEHALQITPPSDLPEDRLRRLVEAFLSGKSPRTIEEYRRDLQDFAAFLDVKSINEAARRLLSHGHGEANALGLDYRADLLERGLAPATVNRRLAAIRSLTHLGRTLGLIGWRLEVRNVRARPYRDTRGPGKKAIQDMLTVAATRKDPKGRRDTALLRLMYDLGLRRGEIVGLDLLDLDLQRGTISALGKGKLEKELLSLPAATRQVLRAWIAARGEESGPLFVSLARGRKGDGRLTGRSVHKIIRALGASIGVRCWPHGIRHTSVTEAIKLGTREGLDLEEIRSFSRHSSVTTLCLYRDAERNTQRSLAQLVSRSVNAEPRVPNGEA